jgi:hypothetical protein
MPAMQGSCLCGAVRFELDGPFNAMLNCHCSMCRKEHGSLFVTGVTAPASGFRWLSGEDKIAIYRSSERVARPFCAVCGSALPIVSDTMGPAIVPAGLLDGDPGIRPQGHLFAGSKAPWYTITDDLPQYDEYPPEFNAPPGLDRPKPAHKDGVIQGSCLCGDVAYEITGAPSRVMNCHCSRCRHSRGSAHATNLFVSPDHFHWVRGEDKVRRFKVPEAQRFGVPFCARCGGKVPHAIPEATIVLVPEGSLDDAPGMDPMAHIFVASKAPWFEITDDIPQFEEYPTRS